MGRPLLLSVLVLVASGCGTQTTAAGPDRQDPQPRLESSLELAARELLPASYTVSVARVGRCTLPRGAARCANLHARTGDDLPREADVVRAARAHGWSLTSARTPPAGSTELVFRRDELNGRVLLAVRGPVAIVTVTTASFDPVEPSGFAASVQPVCERFTAALARIPRSLPRKEGLARVRTVWHELVAGLEAQTPPAAQAADYRRLLAALRELEGALVPLRQDRVAAAVAVAGPLYRELGLEACIPD